MSSFKYEYVPVEQLALDKPKAVILADGLAEFMIEDVLEIDWLGKPRTTKDGIPKITLKLSCVDKDGKQGNILHDISAKMQWAFIALGKCINQEIYNETGSIYWKSLIGCRGKCILETKSMPGLDPKTNVKRYLPAENDGFAVKVIEDEDGLPF